MLREVGRRAESRGYGIHWIEGRDVPPTPEDLDDLIAAPRGDPQPLVVFDTFERVASLAGYLRRSLLPSLPESARVIVSGRGRPEDAWFRGGWEAVTPELELAAVPLSSNATCGAGSRTTSTRAHSKPES